MDTSPNVAGRIERRLDALGLLPEQVDAKVGLPMGTTERLRRGGGPLPGGRFLRGLCAALDTDEEYLLGLEPGDLIPAELLVEPQGELGLLSPDEEALLKTLSQPAHPDQGGDGVGGGDGGRCRRGRGRGKEPEHRARGADEAGREGETQEAARTVRLTLLNVTRSGLALVETRTSSSILERLATA